MNLKLPDTTGTMGRRDFIKTCFIALGAWLLTRVPRPITGSGSLPLKEARYYRSADSLPG